MRAPSQPPPPAPINYGGVGGSPWGSRSGDRSAKITLIALAFVVLSDQSDKRGRGEGGGTNQLDITGNQLDNPLRTHRVSLICFLLLPQDHNLWPRV